MDQVNVSATFDCDDIFERRKYAELIMKIVNAHDIEHGACTIAVDAPWGIGKSTFLHMFCNEIDRCLPDTENKMAVGSGLAFEKKMRTSIYYNAWEHDDSGNAFASLLMTIASCLDPESTTNRSKYDLLKGLLKNAGTLLGAGVAMMMNTYGTVIANQSANVIKAIGDTITTKKPEDALESLFALARKEASERKAFHDALAGLASTAGQLFIVIDELDRCNPAFAIDVLEVIKHYFDVPNVVFVFGIDMTQMAHAINGRYGGNMDAGGYLSKFFDHHIRLNTPTAKQMIHTVDEKRELDSRQEEDIERIFHACGVTPREIRNIFLKTRTLQDTLDTFSWDKNQRAYVEIITMLFICMKYRKPYVYAAYMSSKGAWDYENWETGAPKIYDFLNRLSPYRTLMPDNAAEMLESCRRRKSSSLTDENDVLQAVGIFGIAVLGTRSGYYSKTFIQILQEWLESVAV